MISDVTSWKVGYEKKVYTPRKHSRESLHEKVKSESDQKKLTFNITCCLVFQKCFSKLTRITNSLTPDQEHKKVFQDTPVVEFCNGKSLKDYLVRAKLQNMELSGV